MLRYCRKLIYKPNGLYMSFCIGFSFQLRFTMKKLPDEILLTSKPATELKLEVMSAELMCEMKVPHPSIMASLMKSLLDGPSFAKYLFQR